MTTPKPSAPRVAALRERRAALGLVRVEVWVRPQDAARVKRYAAQVAKRKKEPPHP
jgi:hypothetical protein